MTRRSEALLLGVVIFGLLIGGVVGVFVADDDDEAAEPTTTTAAAATTTTAAPPDTTTTAPGATTTAAPGATTAPPETTTTLGSGLAQNGTGRAGETDGVTPATGADSWWMVPTGATLLALSIALRRYTRVRPEVLERP